MIIRKKTIFGEHLPVANCVNINKGPCTYEVLMLNLKQKT